MRARLTLAALALLFGLFAQPAAAGTSSSVPVSCPSPSASASPVASPPPSPSAAPGNTAADLCARKQLIDQVRQKLSANLATALVVQDQLTQSLTENESEQTALRSEITKTHELVVALDGELRRIADEQVRTELRIDADRKQAAALARSLYFRPDSFLLEIVTAGSLQELIGIAADTMAAASRTESDQRQLREDQARLSQERTATTRKRLEKSTAEDTLTAGIARLAELARAQEDSRARLAAQIAQTRFELSRADQQAAGLAQQISTALDAEQAAIIALAIQQVWAQVLAWEESAQVGSVPVASGHSKTYRFVWPEPAAVVSQRFGPTDLGVVPSYGGYPHFHTGLDLAAPELTPVLAADDGVVALVGSGATGYGTYVVLGHRGGLVSLYGHLHDALVKPGDSVRQGQPIGLEGSTGNSTGPHVHFELRLKDQPTDPTPYLPPGPPSRFGLNGA